MGVALAVTYHDPQGRLYEQIVRVLPALANIFDGGDSSSEPHRARAFAGAFCLCRRAG